MKKVLLLLAIFFASPSVLAIDLDYHTYGGFTTTVDAFKRIALFYADNLNALILGSAAVGIVASALVGGTRGLASSVDGQGAGPSIAGAFLYTLIGGIIFIGLVTPKGTIHIYDTEQNKLEAVGGVPDLIIITVGGINMATKAFKDTESTSSAYTYGDLGSATPMQLLKSSARNPSYSHSNLLLTSINQMHSDCSSIAMATGALNPDDLTSGTKDVWATLAALKHPAISTTYYDSSTPAGTSMTCEDAYTTIQGILNDPTTFDNQLKYICDQIGLDTSLAAEKIACQGKLEDVYTQTFGGGTSIGWHTGLKNMVLSSALAQAILSGDTQQALNINVTQNQIAEAAGSWEATALYMPVIKSVTLAMLLGATPIMVIMLVTPLLGPALKTFFALFVWYGAWEVADMTALQAMEDSFHAVLAELEANGMGIISVWQTPTSAVKAMSIMGQSRGIAITLATVITASVFKISGHALGSFASKAESNIENEGAQAGKEMVIPHSAGQYLSSMANGNAEMRAIQANGFDNTTTGRATETMTHDATGALNAEHYGSPSAAGQQLSQADSTQRTATADAINSTPQAREGFEAQTAHQIGTGTGFNRTTEQTGVSAHEQGAIASSKTSTSQAAENQALKDQGHSPLDVHQTTGQHTAAQGVGTHEAVEQQGVGRLAEGHRQSVVASAITASERVQQSNGNPDSLIQSDAAMKVADEKGSSRYLAEGGSRTEAAEAAQQNKEMSGTKATERAKQTDGDTRSHFAETASKSIAQEITDADKWDAMKSTFNMDDQTLAQSLKGDTGLTVTPDKAQELYDSGIINQHQFEKTDPSAGLSLHGHAAYDDEGNFAFAQLSATSGHSSSTNNSDTVDNQSIYKEGAYNQIGHDFGSDSSKRATATNPDKLHTAMQSGASDMDISMLSADVAKQAFVASASGSEIGQKTAGFETNAGLSLFGGALGGKASAGYSMAEVDTNSKEQDLMVAHFSTVHDDIREYVNEQVQTGKIQENDKDMREAEIMSGYNQSWVNAMTNGDDPYFNRDLIGNGQLSDVWQDYQHKTGISDTPVTLQSQEEVMRSMSHPTEYEDFDNWDPATQSQEEAVRSIDSQTEHEDYDSWGVSDSTPTTQQHNNALGMLQADSWENLGSSLKTEEQPIQQPLNDSNIVDGNIQQDSETPSPHLQHEGQQTQSIEPNGNETIAHDDNRAPVASGTVQDQFVTTPSRTVSGMDLALVTTPNSSWRSNPQEKEQENDTHTDKHLPPAKSLGNNGFTPPVSKA